MTYEPTNLQRWTRPDHYIGESWPDYYSSGFGQSRDSGALERSNFRSALAALGGETETVIVVRERHWAVGWVEWIAIHESNDMALQKADDLRDAYENYPVVDESAWSEEEHNEAQEVWANCYDNKGRIAYMRKHRGQFDFSTLAEVFLCARGKAFWGDASELLG